MKDLFPDQPTTMLQFVAKAAALRMSANSAALSGFEWKPRSGRTTLIKTTHWVLSDGWIRWDSVDIAGENHMSLVSSTAACAYILSLAKEVGGPNARLAGDSGPGVSAPKEDITSRN